MINIQLKPTNNSIQNKVQNLRLYRLYIFIQKDIEEYFNNYVNCGIRFRFTTVKEDLSKILDNHGIEYRLEYDYDKYSDNVKVFIGKNFVLDIKIVSESEYHI